MADTSIPTVALTSSVYTVTAEGDITLTATASDNRLNGIEIHRNGVLIATQLHNTPVSVVTKVFKVPFTFADNGVNTFTAIAFDAAGNRGRSNSIDVPCNIQPHDTFVGLTAGQSLSGATWDTKDRTWDTKTYLSSDGNGAAKIEPVTYGVAANYLSKPGDVGQAVLFKTTGARSSSGNLFSIAIDCAGSVASNSQLASVEALLNGASTLYIKGDGKIVSKGYVLDPEVWHWLEHCELDAKTYNVRLSKDDNGKRGAVVAAGQLVLTNARASTDRMVQLRTSTQNREILRIKRVEALTVPFEVAATETSTSSGTTTTPKPAAPAWLFDETKPAIAGPVGLVVKLGPKGAPKALEAEVKLYSNKHVGFAGATQDRWRMKPVTVDGIQFIVMAGLDSDGRVDVWVDGCISTANGQTEVNRERAAIDVRIEYLGAALTLYGGSTTFSCLHHRGAWVRYESRPLAWNVTREHILSKITDGTFMPHDTRNMIAANENAILVDEKPAYIPFSKFSDSIASNGKPQFDPRHRIGTQLRGTSAGGERIDVGNVHEWFARLISEVGTNNNTAWLTDAKLQSLRFLAESVSQYPQSAGILNPSTGRLIDPAEGPYCVHRNANAWGPCIGFPQAGQSGYNANNDAEMLYDWMWDTAHRPNASVSFHAWHLSKDLFHLFQVQAAAIAAMAYGTGLGRGSDGKSTRIVVEEERGFAWALRAVIEAWQATPEGDIEAPFLPKALFAKWLDGTLDWMRSSFMTDNTAYSSPTWQAAKYWRIVAPFTLPAYPGEVFASPFMDDYTNWTFGYMLWCGYSKGRDVAEWRSENTRLRAQAGGSWYGADKVLNTKGYLAQWIGKTTGDGLAYSDLASYKAAHPRASTAAIEGDVSVADWKYGRDMYLFEGELNFMARIAARGLATWSFDPKAEALALRARHPGPYTINGIYAGFWSHAKQYVTPLP